MVSPSQVRGIGELNWRETLDDNAADVEDKGNRDWAGERPYLLLDVREEHDYLRGHLVTALHYPHARLNFVNFEVCQDDWTETIADCFT